MARFDRLKDKKNRDCIDVISVNWGRKYPIIINETNNSILCRREACYYWAGIGQARLASPCEYLIFKKVGNGEEVNRCTGDWSLEYQKNNRIEKLGIAKQAQIRIDSETESVVP